MEIPVARQSHFNSAEARLLSAALSCYLQALRAIALCVQDICRPLGTPYRLRLLRDVRRLGFHPRPEALEASRVGLEGDLVEFAERWGAHQAEGVRAASDLLAALSAAGGSVGGGGERLSESRILQDVALQLRVAAALDEPAGLRALVAQQAAGLENVSRRLESSSGGGARERVAASISALEHWLEQGTTLTAVDPHTGLFTRGEAERRLLQPDAFRRPFCLLRFHCDMSVTGGAEQVPDTARESLLARLAEMLTEQVRPRDYVARWSRNCFVAVMEAPERIALSRGPEVARWMSDSYAPANGVPGQRISVKVTVKVIAAEADEPPESLLARLEALGADEPVLAATDG